MGISGMSEMGCDETVLTSPGLLPLLKSIHKHCTLKKFAGQTIGVDAYGWLHRGTVACAIELALDKPTTKYVDFAISRVRMLLDFGVTPYLVFDGDYLPSKAGTNKERRKRRDQSKALGLELYRAGKLSQAHQELQKAADVTPYMARQLIEELKKLNVQYVVAPYEADAQLAYLEQKGIIDGILSEDSDLLVFGARRLLTKLNQYGECVVIERADFALCKEISLAGWTDDMFRRMAILSGCDYLSNIEKMGLKTAYRYVRKYRETDKVLRMIQFEGKFCVPSGYLEQFRQAELTFLHHRVFCPIEQKMVFLTELRPDMPDTDMPYLGVYVDTETAIGVACGDLDPRTKTSIRISHPAPFGRSAPRDGRRQTLASSAEVKPKNSIDSFFKAQRQPLAELDPNSLTPSPSQQRLLDRHRHASWEPRMVSSAPQLRRTVAAKPSTPTISPDSLTTDRPGKASTLSTGQPPKRQRLCSPSGDPSPSKEVRQSPFFSSRLDEASPLIQKKTKSRKPKHSGFEIWSDDSIDDILLGLPDVQQAASPLPETVASHGARSGIQGQQSKSESSMESIPQSSPQTASPKSRSPSHDINRVSRNSEIQDPDCVSQATPPSMICVDGEHKAFEDLLDYHVHRQNHKASLRPSLYHTREKGETATVCSPPTFAVNQKVRTFAEQSPEKQLAALKTLPQVRSTQSLGEEITLTKTFSYQSPERQKSALRSLRVTPSDAHQIEVARAASVHARRTPATRSNRPLRKVGVLSPANGNQEAVSSNVEGIDTNPQASFPRIRGSEDAMVPNSDDEGSEPGEEERRPTLDLKNFAFVPASLIGYYPKRHS